MSQQIDESMKAEVVRRSREGESINKIAKSLRVSKSTIRACIREDTKKQTGVEVFNDAISGSEAIKLLDIYDFMAEAYLKEGLASGVLETKDFKEPFAKDCRLSGKAFVYLAARANGGGIQFKKFFEALDRISPMGDMKTQLHILEKERDRIREQAGEVAQDLVAARTSLQEARDYIKAIEKQPRLNEEKIRDLEEKVLELEKALLDEKEKAREESAKADALTARLDAIRRILDTAIPVKEADVPAAAADEASKAEVPDIVPVVQAEEETADLAKGGSDEDLTLSEWAKSMGINYGWAAELAKSGRITKTRFIKGRYFMEKDSVIVPGPREVSAIKSKDDLPEGYVTITEWSAKQPFSKSKAWKLAKEGKIPGIVKIGSRYYVHKDICTVTGRKASSAGSNDMITLKAKARMDGVSYNAVRRAVKKSGAPECAQQDGRFIYVPVDFDLRSFLQEDKGIPDGYVPVSPLIRESGIPHWKIHGMLEKAGVPVYTINGRNYVPEGTDLKNLEKKNEASMDGLMGLTRKCREAGLSYGCALRMLDRGLFEIVREGRNVFVKKDLDLKAVHAKYREMLRHHEEGTVQNAPAARTDAGDTAAAETVPEKGPENEDAVYNAVVTKATEKRLTVIDVCHTVFDVMVREYGYELGEEPTFEAVRKENGEKDFLAILKNFDKHYATA